MNVREAALERDQAARQRLAGDAVQQIKQRRTSGAGPINGREVEAGWNRARTARPTETECRVLQLAADGLTNAEIADQLGKGIETVKSQMRSVLERLRARDRTNAVAIGIRNGHIN